MMRTSTWIVLALPSARTRAPDGTQQLWLQFEADVADLVEKERAS
jgi:hypothetical protein